MLSHVDHVILGMNSVQLYMKIPGCRTPGVLKYCDQYIPGQTHGLRHNKQQKKPLFEFAN